MKDYKFGAAKFIVFHRVYKFEPFLHSIKISYKYEQLNRQSVFYIFTSNFSFFIFASLLKTKILFLWSNQIA